MGAPGILVISDTHGHIQALETVLHWAARRSFEAAIFLGDGAEDIARAAESSRRPWLIMRGNGDQDPSLPTEGELGFAGHSFFLTHGHRYALYDGYGELTRAAWDRGAEAALFGHTHIPFMGTEDGILLVNPGSLGRPRSRLGPSFATIEAVPAETGTALQVRFWGLGRGGVHANLRKH